VGHLRSEDIAQETKPTTDAVPDNPIIDPDAIANLRQLNPDDGGEFMREIIGIYIEDTPKRIEELKKTLASGDTAAFARAAHTIKGSSSNVGAQALRAVAERLEKAARSEGLGAVAPIVAECEAQYALAVAELGKFQQP
jgi:HPt (histidine-containing phosphotransfer) domain-containing protein